MKCKILTVLTKKVIQENIIKCNRLIVHNIDPSNTLFVNYSIFLMDLKYNDNVSQKSIDAININICDMTNKFKGLYKENRANKILLNVIEPVKVELGTTLSSDKSENEINSKSHFGYFIPMKDSLKNLLNLT